MKSAKFFEMGTQELQSKLTEKKMELFDLRFKHATQQLSSPSTMVECKRDIAKIKTILRQRELNISVEPEKATKKAAKKK